jgi:hypothetical protein
MIGFVIAAAPLLLLLGLLLAGIYPGCETILRLTERLSPTRVARSAVRRARRPDPPSSFAPRGGLLIALGRAQRPPPLAP